MNRVYRFPWYVVFISIYPALHYWAYNATQMSSINGSKLVIFSFLFGILVWGIALLLLRKFVASSFITFVGLLLFWSYGHFHFSGNDTNPLIFRHAVLVPLWILLFADGVWWAIRKTSDMHKLSGVLNLSTAILLIFPLTKIIPRTVEESQQKIQRESQAMVVPITGIKEARYSHRPDIYYIILDSYTREDILKNRFAHDNSGFISQLEELGFLIADCSQSNYSQTRLSLSSSLNYRYLDEIYPIDASAKQVPVVIKNSAVQRILESWGYKTVAFETGHVNSELTNADIYFSRTFGFFKLTEFDLSFLETSFLKPFMREPFYRADLLMAAQYRARVLFVLDKLAGVTKIEGPKFVFAHVLIPHPPFVLGPNGEPTLLEYVLGKGEIDKNLYIEGFVNQTIYANRRILEIVRQIIAESSQPPIIVIQGDHGPHIGKVPVTSILNAYYLPGMTQEVYKTITPVNTFRLIFNFYFGQDLEMLEDVSRWSSTKVPLKFEIIPNACNPAE